MPQAAQAVNPLASVTLFLPILLIFYFLVFRPERKKVKEHEKMISQLVKNDEIVTTGGIHGTIVNVKDRTIIVRIDENVKIELEKNHVACIVKKTTA